MEEIKDSSCSPASSEVLDPRPQGWQRMFVAAYQQVFDMYAAGKPREAERLLEVAEALSVQNATSRPKRVIITPNAIHNLNKLGISEDSLLAMTDD